MKKKEQCAVLDKNGLRCRGVAVRVERIHTDEELYGYFEKPHIPWVRVPVCQKHKTKFGD